MVLSFHVCNEGVPQFFTELIEDKKVYLVLGANAKPTQSDQEIASLMDRKVQSDLLSVGWHG